MANTIPRIKLRIDTTKIWQRSLTPLYEVEVAISYDIVDGKKKNFKMRIGKGDAIKNSCIWRDAADLTISKLSDEDMQALVANVIQQLGDVFADKQEFVSAMQSINQDLLTVQNRLSNRVKADVSGSTLVLSTDD